MADTPDLKEKVLCFEEKAENKYKDKVVWNFTTAEGGRFSCWDENLAKAIVLNQDIKVRYEVKKNEKYTNFTIKAVCLQSAEGGWGEWIEGAKFAGKGGFKAFDSEGANKRTCLQAAATIVAAQMAKTPVANPVAVTIDMTAKLMAGVFGAKAAEQPKVSLEKAVATIAATKKQVVVNGEAVEDLEAGVPF